MNVIFHVPKAIDPRAQAGFHVRVPRMIKGFRDSGCAVDVVSGDARSRRALIKALARRIRSGERFDFLYAENATIPTLLTEKHHLPLHPFLDFGFFRLCRRHGIPIGVFYRDIYWRQSEFREKMSFFSRLFAVVFHYVDLRAYRRYCARVFLPSRLMGSFVPVIPPDHFRVLPPGLEERPPSAAPASPSLRLFYVGGLGSFYKADLLFRAARRLPFVTLTVCCRPEDWKKAESAYRPYLNERIRVVHATGKDLEPFFRSSDIGSLFLEPQRWRDFAMPIKLFEYLEHGLPAIGTTGTAAADFILGNHTGWVIDYTEEALVRLLENLHADCTLLETMRSRLAAAIPLNTWRARAETVIAELTANGGTDA